MAEQLGLETRDAGFDRQPIVGRSFEIGDVAHAEQRQVQRAGNRRGGHRQHVDRLAERLEPFFHLDAEPLLLVDDQQAQVGELHVVLGQPMGADDDVDGADGEGREDAFLLGRRAESRQGGDGERKRGHAVAKRAQVLLGQDRGRHQHRHLVAAIDRFEGRPHGHFGLAEADVAAEQAVHRPRLEHVALDRGDGRELIARFAVGKRGVEFLLPGRVARRS